MWNTIRLSGLLLFLFLSGCLGLFGPDLASMTAAQIKATSTIKDVNVTCSDTPTPWGTIRFRHIQSDKGLFQNGGSAQSLGDGCGVQISNNPPPAPNPNTPPNAKPAPQ